jgi:hypothetical protein
MTSSDEGSGDGRRGRQVLCIVLSVYHVIDICVQIFRIVHQEEEIVVIILFN